MKGDSIRGLAVFISDIRNCKSREAELKRINKELANIRSKFRGDKPLDGYQKKKYVCKLLFIFLLGHDIDFGHMEAVNLLSSNRYSEKQIGYLFISVLVSRESDLMKLIIQSVRNDLASHNPIFMTLALQCVANLAAREMVEALSPEVTRVLLSGDTADTVKQSAALALLAMLRAAPDAVPTGEWHTRVIHLLNDQHMGVVTAAVSLIEQLARRSPDELKGCVSLAVSRLSRIVTSSYTDLQDYTYYFVPCPWLSVRLLRLLQNLPPPEDASIRTRLNECLESILAKASEAPKSKKVQHSNARNAVLIEAINLIIHLDSEAPLLVRASNILGQFLAHRETNLRYLALEGLCLLATSEFAHESVRKHEETVVSALKSEKDVSVRQRAVDLLYAMCDKSNAEHIVAEMLAYLETADYMIREELVLKIAILAEKYASDSNWYVDTILQLLRVAGEYVADEVWCRVLQIIVNREQVQAYAARTCFEALRAPSCHENMLKVGGYVLGEFGNLIAGDPASAPAAQFRVLHDKFHLCSGPTRALLLTSYVKLANLFPELKPTVTEAMRSPMNLRGADVEIQQRAVEYGRLVELATTDLLATVLEEMPPFAERESSILAKLKKKNAVTDGKPGAHSPAKTPGAIKLVHQISASTSAGGSSSAASKLPPAAVTPPGAGTNNTVTTTATPTADLLGLDFGAPAAPPVSAVSLSHNNVSPPTVGGHVDSLLDVFDQMTLTAPPVVNTFPQGFASASAQLSAGVEQNLAKFVLKNSGVLYEDEALQVGIKAEFRQNLCKLGIYYGNKTAQALQAFSTEMAGGGIGSDEAPLDVQLKPTESTLAAGVQLQQSANVECRRELVNDADVPNMILRFLVAGVPRAVTLRLPLALNKFLEPTEMTAEVFFQRWKFLCAPGQECLRVFASSGVIDTEAVRAKWVAFGLSALVGVDPNPSNQVGAAILHTTRQQIGCLARLEPNLQTQQLRLTVRSIKPEVALRLAELLIPNL